jgi:hypothetical protein
LYSYSEVAPSVQTERQKITRAYRLEGKVLILVMMMMSCCGWRVRPLEVEGSSRGQSTKGVAPAWEFGEGLTTPHRKKTAGSCEHGKEPSGSVKGGEILD